MCELEIRGQAKLFLKHLEDENLEKAREIIFKHKQVLQYNLGLAKFTPLLPRIRFSRKIPNNFNALKMIISTAYDIYSEENNVNELIFFAAAKCALTKLEYCVKNCSDVNQTRDGDNILMFMIKYGNLVDVNFVKCLKIVIEAGVEIDKNDYFSHNPISFVTSLLKESKRKQNSILSENLNKSLELLETTKDNRPTNETLQTKLFRSLTNDDDDTFARLSFTPDLEILNSDDGNCTLLQLCCQKGFEKSARFLIEKGANLTKTTARNQQTPLEIAARRNYKTIFDMLLAPKKIQIGEQLFITFLHNRPKHIKQNYFNKILKYEGLDLNIRSSNGNTPLHYAIIFSCSEAVEVLLKRGASLTVQNKSQKCALDYISLEDLEKHFDNCLRLDTYYNVDNGKYKVAINYQPLIGDSELVIVTKICTSPKLQPLLNHPLVSSFADVKWKLVEPLYKKLFVFQVLFYITTVIVLLNFNNLKHFNLLLASIYSVRVALTFNWSHNKCQEIVDISIVTCLIVTNFLKNYETFALIVVMLITISFQLFWKLSPNFSVFHTILTSIAVYAFSYLFYVLTLTFVSRATYYMHLFFIFDNDTASALNINILQSIKLIISQFYFLYVFGMVVSALSFMVINSLAHLQKNVPKLIQNSYENFNLKSTLIFLANAEKFWLKWGFVDNPLLFAKARLNGEKPQKHKYMNYFINLNKFSSEDLICVKLDKENVKKFRNFVTKKHNVNKST